MSQEADGTAILELAEIILGPDGEVIFDSEKDKGRQQPIKEVENE